MTDKSNVYAGLLIDSERVYTDVTSAFSLLTVHCGCVIHAGSSMHIADELLAPYGKEMTWDIKAGLMGKRASRTICIA